MRTTLGFVQKFGDQWRILTERGWVIVDTEKELEEELDRIEKKNNSNQKPNKE